MGRAGEAQRGPPRAQSRRAQEDLESLGVNVQSCPLQAGITVAVFSIPSKLRNRMPEGTPRVRQALSLCVFVGRKVRLKGEATRRLSVLRPAQRVSRLQKRLTFLLLVPMTAQCKRAT